VISANPDPASATLSSRSVVEVGTIVAEPEGEEDHAAHVDGASSERRRHRRLVGHGEPLRQRRPA
jgi:hypothetical protein